MNLLSFCGSHDASISTFDGKKVRYFKVERNRGAKHCNFLKHSEYEFSDKDKINATLNFIKNKCKEWNFWPDAIAFIDHIIATPKDPNFLWNTVVPLDGFNVPTFVVDHHYGHILSTWPIIKNKIDFGVAADGFGDHLQTHKVIPNPWNLNSKATYHTQRMGLSWLLTELGRDCFGMKGSHLDFAGKIMGAQSYGTVDQKLFSQFECDIEKTDMENFWKNNKPEGKLGDQKFDNWLATIHEIGVASTVNLFKKYTTKDSSIVFTGGVAQNAVLNERLHKIYGDNLYIPPHPYDGGLSLGCLEFLRLFFKLEPFDNSGFPYWQQDEAPSVASDKTIEKAANMLMQGNIIGWFQGKGEIGPRALGNRSILMNPAIKNGKDILNSRIKHREYWRPFAPSVLESECEKWFHCKFSHYMLRAVQVKEDKKALIPSVTHVDGTARLQSVTEKNNLIFHKLLTKFYEKSGIPMLLNTSLNVGGQPIFAYKKQCLEMIENTDIDAIFFGDEILAKKTIKLI